MGGVRSTKQRRRGIELEQAILESAWRELSEYGYPKLTMQGVASRAGTSRSVLARRWESKAALSIAALRHKREEYPLSVADCGDMREELLEYLDHACGRGAAFISVILSMLSSEPRKGAASSLQDLRSALVTGEDNVLEAILHRAVGRGEVDAEKLTPVVRTLLADLFRHYAIMTLSPPPSDLRIAWVDEVFIPLVRNA